MVIVAFAFKLLDVIYIVVNIVTVNAFFIDWELVCYCNSVNRVCLLSCWNMLHYYRGRSRWYGWAARVREGRRFLVPKASSSEAPKALS